MPDEKNLVGEFDAAVWAREFVVAVRADPGIATDEATMLGWFTNAIMAGYDQPKPPPSQPTAIEWYDDYQGPKTLYREDGQYVCRFGYNVPLVIGGITGREVAGYGATLEQAVEDAREKAIKGLMPYQQPAQPHHAQGADEGA